MRCRIGDQAVTARHGRLIRAGIDVGVGIGITAGVTVGVTIDVTVRSTVILDVFDAF